MKNIIRESLLVEGRKEDVYEKYISKNQNGPTKDRLISAYNLFVSDDPSGNHKYLDWMMKILMNIILTDDIGFDMSLENNIIDLVRRFHIQVPRLEKKDINQYKNLRELSKSVESSESKLTKREERLEGADKIYEDDNLVVVYPKTKEGSCVYGSNTRWCVSARDDNQYNNYSKSGTLYFIIWKLNMPEHLKHFQKIARYIPNGGVYETEGEFYDSTDEKVDDYQIQYYLFGIKNEYSPNIGYTTRHVPENSKGVYSSWEQAKIKIDTHYALNGMKKPFRGDPTFDDDWGDEF